MNKVKLDYILEAIELSNEEGNYYYNKLIGEVIYIGEEERRIAEESNEDDLADYPEWQRDSIEAAIDIEENWDNYISLPSKFDIDEYGTMVKFCYSLDDESISSQLLNDLNGKGAFRRFKDTAIRFDVEKKWYDFRDEVFKKIAVDWCNENDIVIESGMK